jgi:hypothetical protein
MTPTEIITIVGVAVAGAVGIVAAIIGAPRALRDPLDGLKKMTEIYNALPANSAGRPTLLERIEQRINGLDTESTARRNGYGIFWGIFFAVVGVGFILLIGATGGTAWWWSPLPGLSLIVGILILAQNATKVPRAANGQTLKYQAEQAAKQIKKAPAVRK